MTPMGQEGLEVFSWKIYVPIMFLLLATLLGLYWNRTTMKNFPLVLWMPEPTSFDPMKHDIFVHHILQRPLLSTLVSQYKAGEVTGVLAKSWSVSDDKRVWTFAIRPGLVFEDGTPILPQDIKRSLTRTAFLMKQSGSNSGFLEMIEGYEHISRINDDFSGIKTSNSSVTFVLKSAPSQFLEKLSFGLYAVVHKDDYDEVSGVWKNPKQVTSSGPYRLQSWENDFIDIEVRDTFPDEVFPNKKFQNVKLTWKSDVSADIYFGDSLSPPAGKDFTFSGGVMNQIIYLKISNWKDSNSLLGERSVRTALRNAFYSRLSESKFPYTLSFLPLGISGVKEFKINVDDHFKGHSQEVRIVDVRNRGGWRQQVMTAFEFAANDVGLVPKFIEPNMKTFFDHFDEDLKTFEFDITTTSTGVLIEQPIDDLKFMVLSKEGIRLPDPTGRLRDLVSRDNFEPQDMNKILWDDALIWPLSHSASGLWIDSSRVDFSLINSTQPPTEIALIQPR